VKKAWLNDGNKKINSIKWFISVIWSGMSDNVHVEAWKEDKKVFCSVLTSIKK